ncbi:hypothetical protein [Streptomyces agglomeratus]|uniref:hypothetical protein n=1 Tax=Streptomyces agglomeratus TaxID=285458 RepID=UPI001C4084D5|nr:hypothetical protein [Streptomyces agglomeratus]
MRSCGASLHVRLEELRERAQALVAQYQELKDAEDEEEGLVRRVGVLTAIAANHDARAAVYDRLVTAEPSLSDEHRDRAEHQRSNAYNARKQALLTTRRTS